MVCTHWDKESYFCNHKKVTINPDELSNCAETCLDYSIPIKQKEIVVTCNRCDAQFPLNKATRIEVKSKEYIKCPNCGTVVDLKRDDKTLSKGLE